MGLGNVIVIVGTLLVIAIVVAVLYIQFFSGSKFTFDIGGHTPKASGGTDDSQNKGFNKRLSGLSLFSGGVFAVLLSKLWSMQLVSSNEYSQRAEQNLTRIVKTPAPRGRILDRNGNVLVDNRPSIVVRAMPEVLENEIEIKLLANLLGMPEIAVKRKIQDMSEGAQSARTICVDAPRNIVAYIGEHTDIFKGVTIDERTQRRYPHGNLAAHVLGYTGPVTQEQLEKSKENKDESEVSYALGDIVGQAGVEAQYESVLQGVRGEQKVYVDVHGRVTDYSSSVPAVPGSDVVLGIDIDIQKAAEHGLQTAIKMAHKQGNYHAKSGGCVVLDAKTGEVVALASVPTFSPSIFIGGVSQQEWNQVSSKASGYPLLNRIVSGQFMSASTIKPLSVFAAMDSGVADAGSTYQCGGWWTGMGKAYGKWCWNHNGHGTMTLESGITYSCDVVFYEIAKSIFFSKNKEVLQQTFRRWGLEKLTGIDLPGESKGVVPDAKWKWDTYASAPDSDRVWQGGDTANIAIGQGDMLVTPIQMACVYMGIANKGDIWTPHVMREVRPKSSKGSIMKYKRKLHLDPKQNATEYSVVDNGLYGAVYRESESIASLYRDLGVTVHGKTGTGERPQDDAPTGWFVAYAPAEDPQYVACALLENGGFGATTACYTVSEVFHSIFLGTKYDDNDNESDEDE